jgi:iron(III) transport system substrate-binding protein
MMRGMNTVAARLVRSCPAAVLAAAALLVACKKEAPSATDKPAEPAVEKPADTPAAALVVYSGRSEKLVGPILARFEKETGTKLEVRYGETAALATLLLEEGAKSPAAVFLAQDVGAVGALTQHGLLATLPDDVLARVPETYRAKTGTWVGVTGRVRTIAYLPSKTPEAKLPASILDLTKPEWKGKVGWAPSNASFQVFVTGVRKLLGEEAAATWLTAMKANGAKEFPKNGAIVQAVAAGEVDLGLVNHYYLYQFLADDPAFPVKNHFTAPRDAGSLVNLSAVGILASARPDDAKRGADLARFLLSEATQNAFATETHEYPLVAGAKAPTGLTPLAQLQPPPLDLSALGDLEGTLALLKRTGVLP